MTWKGTALAILLVAPGIIATATGALAAGAPAAGAAGTGAPATGGLSAPPMGPAVEWTRWPAADALFTGAGPSTSGQPSTDARAWTGADAAYTIDLGGDRVLWLFGDTFVGKVENNVRKDVSMVRNTVAIQTGRDPEHAKIAFHLGRTKLGVFTPPDGRGWIWPLHGARTPAGLAVFLSQIEATGQPGAFGFKMTAHLLALVENPDDPPDAWRTRMLKVPGGAFGIAVTPVKKTLYVWGYRDDRDEHGKVRRDAILARASLESPERFDRWLYWNGNSWSQDAATCSPLFPGCATELSVHGTGPGGGAPFLALYTENGFSPRILARTAPAPEGPWSEPREVYRCRESAPGIFTYAAKAHPELTTQAGEIVATYLTNSNDLGKIVNDAKLYRPLFIRGR